MKTVLHKMTMQDAIKLGYQGVVLVPVEDDLDGIPFGEVNAEVKANKQRTLTQNRAIHKYLSMLSEDLNNAGLDMKKVIKDEVDIPWDEEGGNAKEMLWRPIQMAMKLPKSTADLSTIEVNQVYQVLSRHMSVKHNICTPFPSRHGE